MSRPRLRRGRLLLNLVVSLHFLDVQVVQAHVFLQPVAEDNLLLHLAPGRVPLRLQLPQLLRVGQSLLLQGLLKRRDLLLKLLQQRIRDLLVRLLLLLLYALLELL